MAVLSALEFVSRCISKFTKSRSRTRNHLVIPIHVPKLNENVLYEIFKHLETDYKSLLSCVLVCRFWCQSALPLYWADPFQHLNHKLIVSSYIRCLDSGERTVLFNNEVGSARYNYANYLKSLRMGTLYTAVEKWVEYDEVRRSRRQCRKQQQLQKKRRQNFTFENSHPRILNICHSLCRLFLSNNANILDLSLDWGDIDFWQNYPSELYFQNESTSLVNLNGLSIHYIYDWPIFKHLAKSAVNIENLEILGYSLFPAPKQSDENDLGLLISNQRRLKTFKLFGYGTTPSNTISAIASQKNSLSSVEIIYVHFSGTSTVQGPSLEGLAACRNLREIIIKYCTFANDGQLKPLASARFPYLQKLHFVESTYGWDETMVALIRNNYQNLDEVFFKPSTDGLSILKGKPYSTEIVEVVEQLCPALKTLGIPIGWNELRHLKNILNNPKCQLRNLSLFPTSPYTGVQIMEEWPAFGPLMPTTLRHLNVCIKMNDEYMKKFLESIRAPLETLWFDAWLYVTGSICLIVYDFIKRRDRVTDLGLKQSVREFLKYVV
ncbi:9206_t:CDS:1 [Ambispora gerdemannii]|uniref:9206_t:CDS:1 n=1 Tax=Ambispora gerdemannii TaxID=144530 RepID=A0A9N8W624_9GLOM|nr:9206_t:CDS:1 [Ambispora gerdemannii]